MPRVIKSKLIDSDVDDSFVPLTCSKAVHSQVNHLIEAGLDGLEG